MIPTKLSFPTRARVAQATRGRSRRRLALMVAALSTILLAGCLSVGQTSVATALNADRAAAGRKTLPYQADAQDKAQRWAVKMAADGALSHSVLSSGIHVRWCSLGENVGRASSVRGVEAAYMASAPHRANILATRWNGVGAGYAVRSGVVYTVQIFIQTC
jgi:uncharacterized protein YkwD